MINPKLATKIKHENIKLHNERAKIYDKIALHLRPENQRMYNNDIDLISRIRKGDALDVGAGTGNISLKLLKRGYKVTAIDISKKMLEILKKKAKKNKNLKIVSEDIDSYLLNTKKKFDLITFCSVLHHFPYYLKTLENSIKLLKKGGIIYIVDEPITRRDIKIKLIDTINFLIDNLIRTIKHPIRVIKIIFQEIRRAIFKDKAYSNMRLAEFHARHGLNENRIKSILKRANIKFIVFKKYNSYPFKITKYLANLLNCKNSLKIIGQKLR